MSDVAENSFLQQKVLNVKKIHTFAPVVIVLACSPFRQLLTFSGSKVSLKLIFQSLFLHICNDSMTVWHQTNNLQPQLKFSYPHTSKY